MGKVSQNSGWLMVLINVALLNPKIPLQETHSKFHFSLGLPLHPVLQTALLWHRGPYTHREAPRDAGMLVTQGVSSVQGMKSNAHIPHGELRADLLMAW